MRKFIILLSLPLLFLSIIGCDSHREEIDAMKKNLLWGPFQRGKTGTWSTQYPMEILDNEFICKENMTLNKDGSYKEDNSYYLEGQLMAKSSRTGKWKIEYDGDLNTFFFDQFPEGSLKIENVYFNDEWFRKFDTDLRSLFNWDVNDKIEFEEDEDAINGLEIIDCTPEVFIIKDLYYDETYRYEQAVNYLQK